VGSTPTLAIWEWTTDDGRLTTMNIELKTLDHCKRQLDIEIPASIVNEEITRASDEMARHVRIPGFRPGRVPRSVVLQRYKAELRQEAVRNLLPAAVETAVEQNQLRVVGEPSVEGMNFADDGTLTFTVGVEVFPEFELAEYRNLAITKKTYKVTDTDVEKVVEGFREDAAELVADDADDREARDGDLLSVDVDGSYVETEGHAHAHPSLETEDLTVEIGGKGVLEAFSDNLRGAKTGETRNFRVDYPQEFVNPSLAGHSVDYTVRVAAIRTKELPALDDEFAASASDGKYETVEAMRANIREELERRAVARSEQELETALIDALLGANEFPVPDAFVNEQAESRIKSLVGGLAARGADPRRMNLDWASLATNAKSAAERDVRAALIIDRIADGEKVDVSDEDVEAEIARLADRWGQDEERVRARLTKEGGADTIRNRVRHRKVLDLVAQAAQTTVEEIEGLDVEDERETAE
jgi:trigger factor